MQDQPPVEREESKEEKKADASGPPADLERIGVPTNGWIEPWNDAWDEAINTGLTVANVRSGDEVDVWFRGFWWRAHIAAVNLRTGTATISFDHTPLPANNVAGYRISLIRPRLLAP